MTTEETQEIERSPEYQRGFSDGVTYWDKYPNSGHTRGYLRGYAHGQRFMDDAFEAADRIRSDPEF